jgi:hypothetical protein
MIGLGLVQPKPPDKPQEITLAFCMWLHRYFDELIKEFNS